MAEPNDFLVDDALLRAAASGFHAAGTSLVKAIADTGPDGIEFLRLVRARVRGDAAASPPPEIFTGPLRDRWVETAVAAINHIFSFADLGPEN